MKAATDAQLAAARGGGHDEATPRSYQPQEWTVGQWILFKTTAKEGAPAVTRISVVDREGAGYWLEQDVQDYFHHTITKILYSRMPRTADEAADALQKMITKKDGEAPQTSDFTSGPGAFTKVLMKKFAPTISAPASVEGSPKEDATVAAGTFRGCAKYQASFSFGPVEKQVTSWFHPGVPINGGVKGASTDGDYSYELLDYGLTGARSAL
jgi:hypothetical protein